MPPNTLMGTTQLMRRHVFFGATKVMQDGGCSISQSQKVIRVVPLCQFLYQCPLTTIALKDGQSTIVIDIHCRYPHACVHQHSLQTPVTRPVGFSQQGPSEVYYLCEELAAMVEREEEMKRLEYQSRIILMGRSTLSQRRRAIQTVHISLPTIISPGGM
jgi:hypothetical protein